MRLFWAFREWLIRWFGRKVADRLIWWLVEKFGTYYATKSLLSMFPLEKIVFAPDFDAAIEDARRDYLAKRPGTTINVPGFKEWLKENT